MMQAGRNTPCPCGSGKKYKKCCGIDRQNQDVQTLLDNARKYFEDGLLDRAEAIYKVILQEHPQHSADAYHTLAQIALKRNDNAEAERFAGEAIKLNPKAAPYRLTLGCALLEQGKFIPAAEQYHKAMELAPEHPEVYNNFATAILNLGFADGAIDMYNTAIRLRHNYTDAHWGLSLALLTNGNFTKGWEEYEWRIHGEMLRRPFPQPMWDGSSLQGKTILIHCEQGIGDQIMFASMFAEVSEQCERCIVECEPRLIPLFKRSFPRIHPIPVIHKPEDFHLYNDSQIDYKIAMGSLPKILRKSLEDFPQQNSYLIPDPIALDKWMKRYQGLGAGLKVGISWLGGKNEAERKLRSADFGQWARILSIEGVQFINLQYGDSSKEIVKAKECLGITIHHWDDSDPLIAMDDFAAQVSALDLVISIDNSAVHLSGALGVPTWVILPVGSNWRWMIDIEDSPWYKTVRLFRLKDIYWEPAFESISKELVLSAQTGVMTELDPVSAKTYRDMYSHDKAEENVDKITATTQNTLTRDSTKCIAFLNDTTHWYHWGCTGTSTAICEVLQERGYNINRIPITFSYQCTTIPRTIEDFDSPLFLAKFITANESVVKQIKESNSVVVNGEGSLHGLDNNVLNLLYLAYAAKVHFRKKVHIINHSCYPDNSMEISGSTAWNIYKKVYLTADSIAMREPVSFSLMEKAGIPAVLSFDCLPLYIQKHYLHRAVRRKNHLLLAGSVAWRSGGITSLSDYVRQMINRSFDVSVLVGADMFPAQDDVDFVNALRHECPRGWTLIDAKTMNEWLDAIAGASIFVSGRFHHTIAAYVLGTPFIQLESNTAKSTGLANVFNSVPPIAYSDPKMSRLLLDRTQTELSSPDNGDRASSVKRLCEMAMLNFSGIIKQESAVRLRPAVRDAIGTTAFFRNRPLFHTLLQELEKSGRTQIRILFHACSIGVEVYSFVIQYLVQGYDKHYSIECYASDKESEFLNVAQRATFPSVVLESINPEERIFFNPENSDRIAIDQNVLRLVTFLPPTDFTRFQSAQQFDVVVLLNAFVYVPANLQSLAIDRISTYNTEWFVTTGFHQETIRSDLRRNGYLPCTTNIREIHSSWTDRLRNKPTPKETLPTNIHTDWSLPPYSEIPDYEYKYCAIFRKEPTVRPRT
jgi:polysaccharide pyruvyl transferase WcaK-like protein/ADP-heptose:LPS heptosyltransferase